MRSPLRPFARRRSRLMFYLKCGALILIVYYLNMLISWKYYIWSETSFDEQYGLTMTHIDALEIEKKRDLAPAVNVLPNGFLIGNEFICKFARNPETRTMPHVVILVKSFPENVKEREAIRKTWGAKTNLDPHNCRLLFVVGTDAHNTSIDHEARTYKDFVQIDKIDSHYHDSQKMILMLRWINDYCTSEWLQSTYLDLKNYVMFINDDYYLDIDALLLYVHGIDNDAAMTTFERRTFITGELVENGRPQRSISDRHYVSTADYPYDRYPPYISSECFLMTRYNARLFSLASKYVRLFQYDHVYMGLVAYSMSIKLLDNNELFPISTGQSKARGKKPICLHAHRPENLMEMWQELHDAKEPSR